MSEVELKIIERVATITINRPEKQNTLNTEVLKFIHQYLDECEKNQQVRLVTLTGTGDKAFCAGADLSGITNPKQALDDNKMYAGLLDKLSHYPKATLALVNGLCLGGGMGLMLACDLSLAHDKVIMGTPEINIGLFPLMISPLIFRNCLSEKAAMELILTGRKISASEGHRLGLISLTCPLQDYALETEKLIHELASKSTQVVSFGKKAIELSKQLPLGQAFTQLSTDLGELLEKEDAREGIKAFLEKRAPEFKY